MPIHNGFRYAVKDNHIIIRAYCGDEVDVVVPEAFKGRPVTEISHGAFVPRCDEIHIANSDYKERCSQRIRSICLPETVVALDGAFNYCIELEEIMIPAKVAHLDCYTFRLCEQLKAIHVSKDNPHYMSRDGILYSKDGKILILCPCNHPGPMEDCLIGVEEIEPSAFAFNKNLSALVVPETIRTIGSGAFYACESLATIQLHGNLLFAGTGHFSRCTSLDHVAYFNTSGVVPGDEFLECSNLCQIDLHGKYTKIEGGAFKGTKIVEFDIPQGVKSVNEEAFRFCRELKTVTIPKSVTRIQKNAFAKSGQAYLPMDGTWKASDYVTGTTFRVTKGSKADQFCQELGYKVIHD